MNCVICIPIKIVLQGLVLQSGSVPVVVRSDPVVSPAGSSGSHSSVGSSCFCFS